MPYFNQPSVIVQEQMGSLHHFAYRDKKIVYQFFEKETGKTKEKVINHQATNDYDAGINSAGEIYLVCKNEDHKVVLLSNHRDYSYSKVILEARRKAENLNICVVGMDIHVFYCAPQNQDQKEYTICHYYDYGEGWINKEINTISRGHVLNPIQSMLVEDQIFLAYYNVVSGVEQVFIKCYDLKEQNWKDDKQVTSSKKSKLYMDVLIGETGNLDLVYCEYEQGNLVVKYEKYKLEGDEIKKIQEQTISNAGNCQNPTLIYYGEMLWISWVEYNYIASRYSDDYGSSWSDIYLWNQSKIQDVVRHKYVANKADGYVLNYSFGSANKLSFIGFGNLKQTKVIPLKRKGIVKEMEEKINNNEWENKISKEIKNKIQVLEKEIEMLKNGQKRALDLAENQCADLEGRMLIIENFLMHNTRGFRHIRKEDY